MMKRLYLLFFIPFASFLGCMAQRTWGEWDEWGEQPDGTFMNPVIPSDYSDLDCIRVGDDYYAISSTMQYSPGMTILHSTDLVNWEIIGNAVTDLTQIGPELNWDKMDRYGRGVWAGSIRYNKGRFYILFGTPEEGYFITSAPKAEGPWAPLCPLMQESGWDDCTAIWDEQGQGYFLGTKFADNCKTYMFRMSDHRQWAWQNGASLPSEEYKMKFQNRVLECINTFQPDMLYFDDTVLPFYGCDDQIGLNILSHYYNTSAKRNDGEQSVVAMGKVLEEHHKDLMMWDVERGVPDRAQEKYWQTCTCLGSWHYEQDVYERNRYKSAQQVVCMLVDIISKNGNLLLSVPVRGNGTIDEKEMAILADIKEWMDVNGQSIYGTRVWKTFGEGPMAKASNPINAQGFNENNNYSAADIRFVQRNDTVFATTLRYPEEETCTIKSLGTSSDNYPGKVKSVTLLGHGLVGFMESAGGLVVYLPEEKVNKLAAVFAIDFE